MKKYLLLPLLFVLASTTAVFGQDTASGSSTVDATVVKSLSIVKDNNLTFGDVAQNDSITVAITDAGATTFTISGEPNKDVTLSYNDLTDLSDGANDLTFVKDVQYDADNTPATATALSSGSTFALDGTSGNLYVFLGGKVVATSTQEPGAYAATFTLDANY